jgi:type IV pilus assembly protein PilV
MDVFLWNQELARLLPGAAPGGQGVVCIDNTPDDGTPAAPACDNVTGAPYVIKVWWDDKSDVAVAQRFVTSFQP